MESREPEYTVFVSYSRLDHPIVSTVVKLLRTLEQGVFRDEDNIRPGTPWRPAIKTAIQQCNVVLVFWCVHSAASDEVELEYTDALRVGKRVIPILLDPTPLADPLAELQGIDMSEVLYGHALEYADDAIQTNGDVTGAKGMPMVGYSNSVGAAKWFDGVLEPAARHLLERLREELPEI